MHRFYASVGGNLGDTREAFRALWTDLHGAFSNVRCSQLYRTTPQDKTDQPDFLNWAFGADTLLAPQELWVLLSSLELRLGRVRDGRDKGPRIIDIDLLLYADTVLHTDELCIPHPRMQRRAFVLVPLLEIFPHAADPVGMQGYTRFLKDLSDQGIYSLGLYPYNH